MRRACGPTRDADPIDVTRNWTTNATVLPSRNHGVWPRGVDTGRGMTYTVALIALIACREVHASPADAPSVDLVAEYFYPVTPTKVPATLVIGMSDGHARRVTPSD